RGPREARAAEGRVATNRVLDPRYPLPLRRLSERAQRSRVDSRRCRTASSCRGVSARRGGGYEDPCLIYQAARGVPPWPASRHSSLKRLRAIHSPAGTEGISSAGPPYFCAANPRGG